VLIIGLNMSELSPATEDPSSFLETEIGLGEVIIHSRAVSELAFEN